MTASVSSDRSEHDSPTLWLSVLAGSLVVHLLVLLLGRWYFLRPSSPPPGSRSSIEFVEVTPVPKASDVAPKSQATSAPTAPRPPTATQSTSTPTQREVAPSLPKTVESPIETPIQPRSTTPATPTPRPETPPQASPRPSPSIPPRPVPPQASGQLPQSRSPMPPASTGTPSPSAGSSSTPPATTAPNPSNSGGTTPGGTASGPIAGFPLPPAPDTSLPPVPKSPDGSQIGKTPIGSDPAPASFAVTVGLGDRPADANVKEIPDELAQPKETTQIIETSASAGECLLKPEAKNYYTKMVKLRLAISEQGQVIGEPLVVQSSGNGDYDELAQCVIKRWEFIPAYNVREDKTRNAVASNLDVPVRIDGK